MRLLRTLLTAGILAALVLPAYATEVPSYPQTRRDDTVDTLHGTLVPDPYRWLEADPRTSDEVAKWIENENGITFAYRYF